MKGYNEGSLNVVTILHTDRPSPLILFTWEYHTLCSKSYTSNLLSDQNRRVVVNLSLILLFKVRKVTIGDAFTNYLVTNNINGTTVRVKLLDTSTLTIPFLII